MQVRSVQTRLGSIVAAGALLVPLGATTAGAAPVRAARPDHGCAASTAVIQHDCPSPGKPPVKPSKPKQ